MEGSLYRGWDPIFPGYGGTEGGQTGTWPYLSPIVLALRALANQRLARGTRVSTPCGAVATRDNSIFVPELL